MSTRLIRIPPSTPYRINPPSRPPRLLTQLQTRRLHNSSNSRRNFSSFTQPRSPAHTQAGISLTTLLLAGGVSIGVAYLGLSHNRQQESVPRQQEKSKQTLNSAPRARTSETPDLSSPNHILYEHLATLVLEDMAPYGDAPGRPGNLTADQEQKLKDMWLALSEISGIAAEGAQTNGTVTPATTASSETTPKKKSRFSFHRKKEDATETGVDNDKHGQTKEYQQALASLTPDQLRDALWSMSKHDDPDALLLRFLRARKWDVQAALIMLVSTMHWRSQEMHVDDDIMLNGEGKALKETASSDPADKKEGEDFMAQLRMGKSFLHGIDKEGRPCCYVRVRLHRQGEQSEKSLERFTVYTIETARMLLRPPVDTATIVFDMTDFSMANMDYTPVKFMIKCFEANYPESLGSVVVYKSPWIFQGIWKIIKGWLDPVVASKVHFASNVNELEEWIPKSNIMKELGGDEDYTYSYVEPAAGEDQQMEDTATRDKILEERKELVKSYEGETMAWVGGEDKGEGRPRIAQRLAENYWKLDPYVRARSLYDRTGVVKDEGKLDFYPKPAAVATGKTDGGDEDLD